MKLSADIFIDFHIVSYLIPNYESVASLICVYEILNVFFLISLTI